MASSVDQHVRNELSSLKCSICNNVLSLPPINVLSADGTTLQCGRCEDVPRKVVSRNYAYEKIAKLLSFPCIYEGCNEMIPWAEVKEHEELCTKKSVLCPIDPVHCKFIVIRCMEKHCLNKHPNNIFFQSPNRKYKTDVSTPFVLLIEKHIFFVLVGGRPNFRVCVVSLNNEDNVKSTFNLILSSTNNDACMSFEKQKITKYVEPKHCFACILETCSLSHHHYSTTNNGESNDGWYKRIDLSTLVGIFQDIQEVKLKIEIVIKERTNEPERVNEDPVAVAAFNQANHLRSSLQCPICMEYMVSSIFSCENGHVLCHTCRNRVETCPTCRSVLNNLRNYPLENLAEVLELTCTYFPRGCDFFGLVRMLSQHEKDCEHKGEDIVEN